GVVAAGFGAGLAAGGLRTGGPGGSGAGWAGAPRAVVAPVFGALGAPSAVFGAAGFGVAGFGVASAIAFPVAWTVSVTAVFAAAAVLLAAAAASALVASCQARLALAGISGSVACSKSSANLR